MDFRHSGLAINLTKMVAGTISTSTPGPSTAPSVQVAKKLSRSLTFDLESDADLANFMDDRAVIPLLGQDGIDLAVLTAQRPWDQPQEWRNEATTTLPIAMRPRTFDRYGSGRPRHWLNHAYPAGSTILYIQDMILEKFPMLDAFPLMNPDDLLDATSFKVTLKCTRNELDERLADLELRIRWPDNNMDALKTEKALNNTIIQTYWANGGIPFIYSGLDHVWTRSAEGGISCNLSTLRVPATFDIVPCEGPQAPFALTLYDYQLRTLAWMQGIEDGEQSLFYAPNLFPVDDGLGDLLFDAKSKTFKSSKDNWEAIQSRNAQCGIIADKPGVGKTITTLALCHSRPFEMQDYLYSMHKGLFRSKATLILVPNNIASQWEDEIRKCLGDTVTVIQLKGKAAYIKTFLEDILTADFVIVSYQFLINENYRGARYEGRKLTDHPTQLDLQNSVADRETFVTTRVGGFAFTWCHFHRIICDEFHEILESKKHEIREQVKLLSSDFLWGLTGTPTFDSMDTVWKYADLLHLNAQSTWVVPRVEAFRFIQNRVRRNEPKVTYPAPVFETFSCVQTPIERAFYQSSLRLGVVHLLKLCNHYQIGDEGGNLGVLAAQSIEKVTELVQRNRAAQIASLKKLIPKLEIELQVLAKEKKDTKTVAQVKTLETKLEKSRNELTATQSQFKFFENFVNTYLSKGGQKMECNVCLEDDVQGEIGIVPCGHTFCGECADAISAQGRCPTCREQFQVGEVMKALAPPPAMDPIVEDGVNEDLNETDDPESLDPNLFGSKIREVVKYINQESLKSEDHRFIVFIQFSDLADLVSAALRTYGISTARVKSGWLQREGAIRSFRAGLSKPVPVASVTSAKDESVVVVEPVDLKGKGKRVAELETSSKPAKIAKCDAQKPVKVLMLSARDSVSGLNLTEASHCIILHPFYAANESHAVASEKQGVARVLRKGQDKTVKIVRFYVENTVEQALHEARAHIPKEEK
ncbi:SNF2 family N-terminal domain-containing protein [Chytriomyces cf. hyalinus JEL632]|nr:SNF2 family N-terminal domain-containing protein [Chytriomyces cf. hyalinus JEL632]